MYLPLENYIFSIFFFYLYKLKYILINLFLDSRNIYLIRYYFIILYKYSTKILIQFIIYNFLYEKNN